MTFSPGRNPSLILSSHVLTEVEDLHNNAALDFDIPHLSVHYNPFELGLQSQMIALFLLISTEVLNATVQNSVNTLSAVLIGSKGKFAQP